MTFRIVLMVIVVLVSRGAAQVVQNPHDIYDVLLHSSSLSEQRVALATVLATPHEYVPRIRQTLQTPNVLDECIYSCAPVFSLSVYANFGGWKIPANLNSSRATVSDLRSSMQWVPRLTLEKRPLEEVVEGPWLQDHKKEIEGKIEEELIEMAGPATASIDARQLAVYELEVSIARSKNRLDIYLLAMNDIQDTASREYLGAVHTAAFRAELARAKGR
jgi:hypothetical protein